MPDTKENSVDIEEARKAYKQAEADLKAAGNDATKKKMALDARKKAGAEIDLYKAMQGGTYHADIIERDTKKLGANKEKIQKLNKEIVAARRKGYIAKAMSEMTGGWRTVDAVNSHLASRYPEQKITVSKEEIEAILKDADEKGMHLSGTARPTKEYYQSCWKAMDKAKAEKAKLEADSKNAQRNIDLAKAALKKADETRKAQADAAQNGNGGGNGGYGDGSYNEQEQTLTKPYKDENGNVVATATYDKNGKMLECKFHDQNGKEQKLKAAEMEKANVDVEDIKNALESGDLKKALELLLKALTAKQNNYQQETAPKESKKEYTDEDTGVVFTVEKVGKEIKAIRMLEDEDNPLVLSKEMFAKAGVNPKDIEKALEKKDFAKAANGLYHVAEKNGIQVMEMQEPTITAKGESILLVDAAGNEYKLTEDYLKSSGMKGARAKGTMKKLREAMAIKPRPKGLEYAVATYFSGEKPAPRMPETKEGKWSVSKLNKTLVDQGIAYAGISSSAISITVVNEDGTKKKLKAEDFANYFHCDKKEGKKILKAYARAIEDGADLNGVLSEVADCKAPKDKSKKKSNIVGEMAKESGKKAANQVKSRLDEVTSRQINRLAQKVFGD